MIPNQELNPGEPITVTGVVNNNPAPADSIQGAIIYGIEANGGTLIGNIDTFVFFGPWSEMSAEGTVPFNIGFSQDGNDIVADTAYTPIFFLGNDWVPMTDSIKTLLNVQFFEENGVGHPFEDMLYRRSELVDGQTYGWYTHMRPYPNWDEGTFTDPDQTNNWDYTPVIWRTGTTSLTELLKNTKYTDIALYPNPAVDQVSFSIEFPKANKSTVARVLDVSGRAVKSKAYGAGSGTQKYTMDVASLPAGIYSLQIICDNVIYHGKFVKK